MTSNSVTCGPHIYLERSLEEHCGDDFDSIIRSFTNLRLDSTRQTSAAPPEAQIPAVDWAELFVREMARASDMEDAKARASTLLKGFENSIINDQRYNLGLKEQVKALAEENAVLKRAVVVQHRRQKELEDGNGKELEMRRLKEVVSHYQERLRALELDNYALAMHLKKANQSVDGSIAGRFNPDVF